MYTGEEREERARRRAQEAEARAPPRGGAPPRLRKGDVKARLAQLKRAREQFAAGVPRT